MEATGHPDRVAERTSLGRNETRNHRSDGLDSWAKRAPLTGIAAVVLLIGAFALGGETPAFDDSGRSVIEFYVDNEGSQLAASTIEALGALLLLFFAGALYSALRRGSGAPGGLPAVALAGGVIQAVGLLSFAGFSFVLADVGDKLEPGAAQALNALDGDFFFLVAAGTGSLLLASGASMLRTRAFPRWLASMAIGLGILAVTPLGFFAFLAYLIWITLASVAMLRGSEAPPLAARLGATD